MPGAKNYQLCFGRHYLAADFCLHILVYVRAAVAASVQIYLVTEKYVR